MSRVMAFSQKSLFLEPLWREFRISFGSHKPLSKTKRPENDVYFSFVIPCTPNNALMNEAKLSCSREIEL